MLCGTAEFRSGDHDLLIGDGREEIHWRHAAAAEMALVEAWEAASKKDVQWMDRIHRTGLRMSVLPSTVNETELWAHE